MKRTVILGATDNPTRYAYTAASMMNRLGIDFVPVGIKKGIVFGKEILDLRMKPEIKEVDTVSLYIGPRNQPEWYQYILSMKPVRIILNPGTENPELEHMAKDQGIQVLYACTLVILSTGQF